MVPMATEAVWTDWKNDVQCTARRLPARQVRSASVCLFERRDCFCTSRVMRRTCTKAFEVLLVSDVRVAQNHFRPMPLEDNSGKCQTGQSKWIIRIEVLCLINVHIKCLIITLSLISFISISHMRNMRLTCPKFMHKLNFDSKVHSPSINQAFSSKLQHMDTVNYEKSKVLLSKLWPTTDCKI